MPAVQDPESGSAGQQSSKSAFSYFLTATAVSTMALIAFFHLLLRNRSRSDAKRMAESITSAEEAEHRERKVVGMWTLFKKLKWLASAVFVCFGVTMVFPVFTQVCILTAPMANPTHSHQEILSVRPAGTAPRLFEPATFIPLGFLFWNAGDLIGRLLPLIPSFSMASNPRALFLASLARLVFIPLYLLCNIDGRGAVINSDVFYLVIVQLGFGISNGWLGSSCMMGAAEWVDASEREAAGGFMGLALVSGLTVGSLLSFLAAKT